MNLPHPHPHVPDTVRDAATHPETYGLRQWSGWILGPGCLLFTLLTAPPEGLSAAGWYTAGAALLMAVWWITESVPIPVTALLPLVLFPALHLGDIRESAAPFANPIIFLFLGGFMLALAMQRWGLHRRVALGLIGMMGTRPSRVIAGFLLASAFVSLWVSNTATAMMMLPIALSVSQLVPASAGKTQRSFSTALLLSVAYGATAGGMGTLIGTPPNALLAAYVQKVYSIELGFGQWMLLGLPVVALTLPAVHFVLTKVSFKLDDTEIPGMADLIRSEKARLGPASRGEVLVTLIFTLTAAGWVFQPLLARHFALVTDTTIAMTGALLLFLIPANPRRGEFLMRWEDTKGLPWDVLLLFGGGLSLAGNIEKHGLARFLGDLSQALDGWPMLLTLCVLTFGILMLTELTSNTATAATFLPIAGAIALSLGQNPLLFLIPTALAANCSFMMPVGTPPNAIVFGSGQVTLPQMAKAGMILNLVVLPIILALVILLGPWIFDVRLDQIPAWAK